MKQIIKHDLQKGILFLAILVVIPLGAIIGVFISVLTMIDKTNLTELAIMLLVFTILLLLLYFISIKTYYHSKYIIDDQLLKCKMGIFKYSIEIDQINYIIKGKYPAAGNKPALNLKGIKINYGSGYNIFLSPKNVENFVNDLKDKNNTIVVK